MDSVPAIITVTLLVAAYLAGSVSSAILVSKLLGQPDPRVNGSGNPGATNVLRLAGKRAAALTLLGDTLKGLMPVLIAKYLGLPSLALAAVALAAFLGHLYPVFFGFRGGKGVATFLGVLLGLTWWVGGGAILTWLVIALLTRYSSLAALTTAFLAPLYMHWIGAPAEFMLVAVVMTTFLLWRHQGNIRNLLSGTEARISLSR
ncbi:MAG: glycerol-3-phosphate 1-O-acyltransferase PlsY [Gammaproteobacteria bacterium]|nr:glycerol-3-phosphate 1-O-acyltransferase PlsY [Gammaproteobacteria bacterium]